MSKFELHHGDCLEVMEVIPPRSMDIVATDPPYMIGAVSVGAGETQKSGTWADMENAAYWFAAWMGHCKRILKDTGYLLCFGNWRSMPTLIRALSLCNMPATSCMIWDKNWIGPAAPNQLRPRYEIVLFSAKPKAKIENRSAPDIFVHKWLAGHCKETEHPAEKPVELMRHLLKICGHPGCNVLDPFMGTGTTGKAAILEDMAFFGIEREQKWVDQARIRLEGVSKARRQNFIADLTQPTEATCSPA